MNNIFNLISKLNNIIWGIPLSSLVMGTHLFFTFRLRFIQKKIFKGIYLSIKPSKSNEGETSSFGSLTTTLALHLELVILSVFLLPFHWWSGAVFGAG